MSRTLQRLAFALAALLLFAGAAIAQTPVADLYIDVGERDAGTPNANHGDGKPGIGV